MVRSPIPSAASLLRALGILTAGLYGATVGAAGVPLTDMASSYAESGCVLRLTQAYWLAQQGSASAQIHVTWQWSGISVGGATVRVLVTDNANPDPATNHTLDPRAMPLDARGGDTLNWYPTTTHHVQLVASQPGGGCDGVYSNDTPVTFVSATPPHATAAVATSESRVASNPVSPATAAGTTSTSSSGAAGGSCLGPVCVPALPDPGQALSDAIVNGLITFLADVIGWLTGLLQSVIAWATAGSTCTASGGATSPFNLLSSTPPCLTYANSYVQTYAALCRNIALSLVALLICLHGLEIALATRAGHTFDGALDAVRRVALAAVLGSVLIGSNGGDGLFGAVLSLANAMTAAVGGGTLPTPPPTGPTATLQAALVTLLFLVMELILIVQLLLRLALLDLLLVIAPLAVLCYAYPRWAHWATHWAQLTAATVLLQFLQVTALQVSAKMVASLDVSSAGAASATMLQTLLGIAGMVLVVRLPRLLYGLGSVLNGGPPFALGWSGSTTDDTATPSSGGGTTTVTAEETTPRLTAGGGAGSPPALPPASGPQGGPSAGSGSGGPLYPGGGTMSTQATLVPSGGSYGQDVGPAFGGGGGPGTAGDDLVPRAANAGGGSGPVVITEVPPAQLPTATPRLDGPQLRLLPAGGNADDIPPPGGWP